MVDLHYHPHIVSLTEDPSYDPDRGQWRLSMVLGLCDVFDFMLDEEGKYKKFKQWVWQRKVFRDLSQAVTYIHEKGICHLDIKPQNVVVMHVTEGQITAQLIDFGFAQKADEEKEREEGKQLQLVPMCRYRLGAPGFAAPEILDAEDTPYDGLRADLWSLGVFLFVIITRLNMFSQERGVSLRDCEKYATWSKGKRKLTLMGLPADDDSNETIPWPCHGYWQHDKITRNNAWPAGAARLVVGLVEDDAAKRFTLLKVQESVFFNEEKGSCNKRARHSA